MSNPLLDVLDGRARQPPPVWLMRQAGRYLPEYRAVRERVGDFLELCLTPDLAAEVTLQPVRRFGFDAAILFSDILVVPYALGQQVRFAAGEGPQLEAITDRAGVMRLRTEVDRELLRPIYETVRRVKSELPVEVALVGFCGAPWTLASYMIGGRVSAEHEAARLFAYRDPDVFTLLVDRLVDASADYLVHQLEAGVDVVQIFDTWAGLLPCDELWRWCIAPTQRIIMQVRDRVAGAKVIGYPRGAGTGLLSYIEHVAVDAVALDWTVDLTFARDCIQRRLPVQGNLDPVALLAGGTALDRSVDAILEAFSNGPFIFNLGHGILPHTPIINVERMLARVRRPKG